jgi:hypothetical protein
MSTQVLAAEGAAGSLQMAAEVTAIRDNYCSAEKCNTAIQEQFHTTY